MKTNLVLPENMSDENLISYLDNAVSVYLSNPEGSPERARAGEWLGAGIDLAVKRPVVIDHFKRAGEVEKTEEIKTLNRLLSDAPISPTPAPDGFPKWLLRIISAQHRGKRYGGGEG